MKHTYHTHFPCRYYIEFHITSRQQHPSALIQLSRRFQGEMFTYIKVVFASEFYLVWVIHFHRKRISVNDDSFLSFVIKKTFVAIYYNKYFYLLNETHKVNLKPWVTKIIEISCLIKFCDFNRNLKLARGKQGESSSLQLLSRSEQSDKKS